MNNIFFVRSIYLRSWTLLFLFLISCTHTPNHKKMIDIQGHRGCRGLLPENSLIGFQKALEIGVHTLELDVVISKDHKVVVSHEPFMNHEIALNIDGKPIDEHSEKNYNLYQMTYDSIRLYDCGTRVHPRFPSQEKVKVIKPLLEEVIQMAEDKSKQQVRYNIEIKRVPYYDTIYAPKVEEFVRLVLEVIQQFHLGNRVNLQAFDIETLEQINKQAPYMTTALLVDENEFIEKKLEQLSFSPTIISPYYQLLTKEVIRSYQNKGFKVIPWTVNETEEMQQLINWHVDGIITDYPDRLKKLLAK